MSMRILTNVRALDFSTGVTGPYATKLLADAGADVVKVETSGGDPLRRRGVTADSDRDGALFRFLHQGKRAIVADDLTAPDIDSLVADAELVVVDTAMASDRVDDWRRRFPDLVVLSISPFGRTGPWVDRPASDFVLQAESGSLATRGRLDRPPVQVAGRVFDWVAGVYGAVAALAAVRRTQHGGGGEVIDLSMLETGTFAGTRFAQVEYALAGRPPIDRPPRTIEAPSIEPTADGWVGFNTNTRDQFDNFLVLIERGDLLGDDDWASSVTRSRRLDEWNAFVHPWTARQTAAEIIEPASLLRIPVAPVHNGATVLDNDHFRSRAAFVRSVCGTFDHPAPPYKVDGKRPTVSAPSPSHGEHNGRVALRGVRRPEPAARPELPLAGLRVLDVTSWWAGPSSAQLLGYLGAEVIHVEAAERLDGARTAVRTATIELADLPQWWERSPLFLTTNVGKRGVAVNLATDGGQRLLDRLVLASDVLIENFSPRVFENFGLSWSRLSALNERLIMVRMPAFGLDGPWRNNVGFAQTMEQATGMSWITGYPDESPQNPRGPCDPLAGGHAAFAALVGLYQREETGKGCLVEATMVEAALNAAAESIVVHSAYGRVTERDGNRSPDAAPQGLYACRGNERWLALSIETDAQWGAFVNALDRPAWTEHEELATAVGRRARHDVLDEHIMAWAATVDVESAVEMLTACGVPAGVVRDPRLMAEHPQLRARQHFEELEHPLGGRYPVGTLPFRFASVDRWSRARAPMLGEHNAEVLGDVLGLDADSIAALTADDVIGDWPRGVPRPGQETTTMRSNERDST
ncbi:CaiB/BaiF CoA transferase family protein [Candidatus Poriferisocius sp.]|uniref:CaiB/BaiF CoA transferase family protein n=1 Tax=Candidatus Poriferisocius sp. TaxID=3101276 RepID=UPI003B01FDD7